MATKTAVRDANLMAEIAETLGHSQELHQPITATGYDAKGEAVDVPVDTRVEPPLPGFEDEDDPDAEMFEGKRVIGHKWSFTGNHEVNFRNQALLDKLDLFRRGETTLLLVEVEPGDVTHAQSTEDGHVKGVFHKRKLHVTGVYAAEDIEGSEALFEGGLLRVKRPKEPDDIGFLTQEPPIPDDENPLAEALAEAMPIEPGMCGEVHPGHLNQCRQPRHSCPLRAE